MSAKHRVLLFVEPYCVRSGPQDFARPHQLFSRLARALAMHPDIAAGMVSSSALAGETPHQITHFLPADFGIDESPRQDWREQWLPMLLGTTIDRWGEFYESALQKFRPTLVYMWNKNSLFQDACRRAAVPVLTFEYGGIRTPSGFRISVDPRGFGPESALATTTFTSDSESAQRGWDWASAHVHRDFVEMHVAEPESEPPSHRLRVCVLLQKEDDVNFLVWPAFETMWDFIQQSLEKLVAIDDLRITVRPHPAGMEDYSERIGQQFPAVQIDPARRNFYQSLLDFDCVITLNSAAGFEALTCGIPVLSMSAGFYDCGTQARNGVSDVAPFIESVRSRTYWTETKRQYVGSFLDRLVHHYSIPQNLLLETGFHVQLIRCLSGMSPAAVDKWFERTPAELAALASAADARLLAAQISALSNENHLRLGAIRRLEARQAGSDSGSIGLDSDSVGSAIAALGHENHRRIEALAEMTVQNAQRDQAIAQISATLAELTIHNNARDLAIQALHDHDQQHHLHSEHQSAELSRRVESMEAEIRALHMELRGAVQKLEMLSGGLGARIRWLMGGLAGQADPSQSTDAAGDPGMGIRQKS